MNSISTKDEIKTLNDLCFQIPKSELHVHLEGTLDPEMIFKIAERNNAIENLPSNFKSLESIKKSYNYKNLEEFLEIYYLASKVLLKEEDFSEIVMNYFKKVLNHGVKYAEMFFDPQSHTRRGIKLETIIKGLLIGLKISEERYGIKGNLILCFLRDLSEEDAIKTFQNFLELKELKIVEDSLLEKIIGVGLDSSEIGNPPDKFKNVFKLAKEKGFKLCCHCHDEGSLENIRKSVEELNVDRIDHGIDIYLDENLLNKCVDKRIPYTFCPLSTKKVQRTPDLKVYNLDGLLEKDLLVTVNSDDPAFF